MTPSVGRDSFANGRAEREKGGGRPGSMEQELPPGARERETWCDSVPRGQVLFQLYIINGVHFLISNRAE